MHNRTVLVFREFIQVFFIEKRCVHIEVLVVCQFPFVGFPPLAILRKSLFRPTYNITANYKTRKVFYEAIFGVDTVNGNLFAKPFLAAVFTSDCNFGKFAAELCKVCVISSMSVIFLSFVGVSLLNPLEHIFGYGFYLFSFNHVSPHAIVILPSSNLSR